MALDYIDWQKVTKINIIYNRHKSRKVTAGIKKISECNNFAAFLNSQQLHIAEVGVLCFVVSKVHNQ